MSIQQRLRKFDYYHKDYSNPFFKDRRGSLSRSISGGKKVFFALSAIILLILMWVLLFSDLFKIKNLEISGGERIPASDLESIARSQMLEHRYLIGSQGNLFLFNKKKFIEAASSKYFFDSISVNKKLLGKISVEIKEKKPVAFWQENGQYYIINEEGKVLFASAQMEAEQREFPLIENRGSQFISDRRIAAEPELIVKIKAIHALFLAETGFDFKIDKYIFDAEANTIKVDLDDGPVILFNARENLDKQYSKLVILIRESLKDDFRKKNYLDLRYGERVYYQ